MRARSVKRVINRTCSESVSSEAQCAAEGRRTARGGASQDRMEGSGGFPCACTAAGRMGRRDRLLKPPAARNGKMEIMYPDLHRGMFHARRGCKTGRDRKSTRL